MQLQLTSGAHLQCRFSLAAPATAASPAANVAAAGTLDEGRAGSAAAAGLGCWRGAPTHRAAHAACRGTQLGKHAAHAFWSTRAWPAYVLDNTARAIDYRMLRTGLCYWSRRGSLSQRVRTWLILTSEAGSLLQSPRHGVRSGKDPIQASLSHACSLLQHAIEQCSDRCNLPRMQLHAASRIPADLCSRWTTCTTG